MPYRPRHQSRRGCSCLGRILTFLVLLALLCYPFVEPSMLETESVSLTSADLPQDIGQLRIVYLSDIHAGFFFSQSRVNDLVQTVNRLNAAGRRLCPGQRRGHCLLQGLALHSCPLRRVRRDGQP